MIPYKFYAAKVLDSISTGLKIPEGQTKKTGVQHILSSLHTCFRNKKDCLFSKSVVLIKRQKKSPSISNVFHVKNQGVSLVTRAGIEPTFEA